MPQIQKVDKLNSQVFDSVMAPVIKMREIKIQIAAAKIMKARKRLPYTELITEIIGRVTEFKP